MKKNIIGYLLVAALAYGLGQVSTLNAAANDKADKDVTLQMDKVLKNQDQILKMLKKIYAKV